MKIMTLKDAKKFWLVGVGVLLAMSLQSYISLFPFARKLFIPANVFEIVSFLSSALVLVAFKIISDVVRDKKIFTYSLVSFIMHYGWKILRIPIRYLVFGKPLLPNSPNLSLWKDLFFEQFPSWMVEFLAFYFLLLALTKISVALKEQRFKQGGILKFVSVIIFIVTDVAGMARAFILYNSSKKLSSLAFGKILSSFNFIAALLATISLVLLFLAFLHIDTLPSDAETSENSL